MPLMLLTAAAVGCGSSSVVFQLREHGVTEVESLRRRR